MDSGVNREMEERGDRKQGAMGRRERERRSTTCGGSALIRGDPRERGELACDVCPLVEGAGNSLIGVTGGRGWGSFNTSGIRERYEFGWNRTGGQGKGRGNNEGEQQLQDKSVTKCNPGLTDQQRPERQIQMFSA